MHSLPVEPAVIELNHCPLCIFLTPKLDINIAHEVIPQVVAHIHLFNLPVLLLQFGEHFLEEVIIVFLHLHVAHVTVRSVCGLGGVLWIPIQAHPVELPEGACARRCLIKKTTISRETWGISRKSPWLKVAKGPRPEEVKIPLGRGCL